MRFGGRLRTAAADLEVPPGARLRILEEVAADLEDLYAALRATGLSDAEAKLRAERLLAPEAAAVRELSEVHRSPWVRWQERFGPGGSGLERAIVTLLVAGMVALAGLALAGAGGRLTVLIVPVAAIGVAGGARAIRKAVRIWGLGESAPAPIRAGAGDLIVAAVGALFAAAFGIVLELWRVAGRLQRMPEAAVVVVTEWLRTAVALTAAGIGVALVCGLAWLAFVRRAAMIERTERRVLGPPLILQRGGRADVRSRAGRH